MAHPLHVSGLAHVNSYVTRLPIFVCLLAVAPAALADSALNHMLKAIEGRYNHAKTLQVLFTEEYTAEGKTRRPESGLLVLRKPGRMRWSYTTPAGKLFISDGKTVYLYTPELYPTRMRAWATATGSSMNRVASFIAPSITGFILAEFNSVALVFTMMACVALWGAFVMWFFGEETKRRVLEELSP